MRLFDATDEPWIEPTDQSSARYWCEKYHYSGTVPSCTNCYACYEYGEQIGVVCYGIGATNGYASSLGLDFVIELVRVAMKEHETPVTQYIAMTLKMLRKNNPLVDAVISFADTKEGHTGGIYKAGNWICLGEARTQYIRVDGELVHPKTLHSRFGKGGQSIPWLRENIDPNAERVEMPPKIRFAMAMHKKARKKLLALSAELRRAD